MVDVSIINFTFVPKTVTITVGQTVRWTNNGTVGHSTTSGNPGDPDAGDLWDSGVLAPGSIFTRTFNQVGDFRYFCTPHQNLASMRDAFVIVQTE